MGCWGHPACTTSPCPGCPGAARGGAPLPALSPLPPVVPGPGGAVPVPPCRYARRLQRRPLRAITWAGGTNPPLSIFRIAGSGEKMYFWRVSFASAPESIFLFPSFLF